jgi:hypothetical protein
LESRRRRTFILWSLTSIALQFGYYGANTWLPSYLVSDLKVNPQSMGWYVAGTYAMMVLESHHWLPRRHRRTPRDVDCVGDVDGDLAADSDLHCNWLASSYFNGSMEHLVVRGRGSIRRSRYRCDGALAQLLRADGQYATLRAHSSSVGH